MAFFCRKAKTYTNWGREGRKITFEMVNGSLEMGEGMREEE